MKHTAQVGATSSFPVDREGRTVAFKLGVNMSNSRIRRIAEASNLMIEKRGKKITPGLLRSCPWY